MSQDKNMFFYKSVRRGGWKNEDKNISGFLVWDLRKWWRHVQAKNTWVPANLMLGGNPAMD